MVVGMEGTGPGGCVLGAGLVLREPTGPSKEATSGEVCFSVLSGRSWGPAKPSPETVGGGGVQHLCSQAFWKEWCSRPSYPHEKGTFMSVAGRQSAQSTEFLLIDLAVLLNLLFKKLN